MFVPDIFNVTVKWVKILLKYAYVQEEVVDLGDVSGRLGRHADG